MAVFIFSLNLSLENGRSKPLKALTEGDKYPDVSWDIKLGDTNIGDYGTKKTFPYSIPSSSRIT